MTKEQELVKEKKLAKLKKTNEQINKDYGEGSIMSLSDRPVTAEDVISTGSYSLDLALGIGGLPKGRIVEIFGQESCGKTTIATHVVAEAQKLGYTCCVVDAEHAFDRDYASSLGVNVDELMISQPEFGEQGLSIAEHLIDSGAIDVVVIDSVAALTPKGEYEGEMGDSKMGLQARMMSQALRILTGKVARNNVLLIFINQMREKIGVMFGNPETTTGGNALKFYASIRLDVRRSTTEKNSVKDGDEVIGNQTTVKVIKNKVAPPFHKAMFDIRYGEGIDRHGEILDIALEKEIIKKSGSWFILPDDTRIQGKESVRQLLIDNEDYYKQLEKDIKD